MHPDPDSSLIRRLQEDLQAKETELMAYRRQSQSASEQHAVAAQLKRDNESLLESLHKEQDKSYKLLRDLHQAMQEGKGFKQANEDIRQELE